MTLAGSGVSLAREGIVEFSVQVEGHPDSVKPAIFGGFQIAGGERMDPSSVNIPEGMLCSLFISDFHSLTTKRGGAER